MIKSIISEVKKRFSRKKKEYPSKEQLEVQDEYLFLCFMTKKYFRDNLLISLAKIFIGVVLILLSVYMEEHFRATALKPILMVCFFAYGLITIPLSVLYAFANFICLFNYSSYISNSNSPLAKKIIVFYDKDTDKFMAVNMKNLFTYRKAAAERKRIRGW